MGQAEALVKNQDSGKAEDAGNGTSMEEILASIRRIIASENNTADTPAERPGSDAAVEEQKAPAASAFTNEEAKAPVPNPGSVSASHTSAIDNPEARSGLSLSSLAASVKRGIESSDKPASASAVDTAKPSSLSGDPDKGATTSRQNPISERQESFSEPATHQRPVAQALSSTPGGLAALAARIKSETQKSDQPPAPPAEPVPASPSSAKAEGVSNAREPEQPATPTEAPKKNISLSDIAAMASRQSEAMEESGHSLDMEATDSEIRKEQDALQTGKEAPASAFGNIAADAIRQSLTDRREQGQVEEPVSEKTPSQSLDESDSETVSRFREALVAPSTQASVNASMSRLTKAVESVDAAHVEAVLRPMLKEWLDENLPSLVEKLVSEEIARITNSKCD